ncbi:MAG: Pyridoxamine 5-phosphate oxidase [Candidatus Saccharibacteria bacterium]|nr:Pyridoxamine 5-phosphate oxidase [Candidatus Saccharibacteria bacterium]
MTITTSIRYRSSVESEEMINSFITTHPQGSITTANKEGRLQSSVINVSSVSDSQYSFMTKKDTRKSVNIHNSPIVSFITYDPLSQTEAEIEGIAMLVTDKEEAEKIVTKIRADSDLGSRYISPYVNEFDDYILFTIYPYKMHMTTYWERGNGMEVFHEDVEFDTKMNT